jgi:hypothetical protein
MDKIIFENKINNINNKISNINLKIYVNELLKNWFIKLNLNDINILTILVTFLIIRIDNLFGCGYYQFKKNSNIDLKAVILLILPYINDDKIDVYNKLTDLNELILTQPITKETFELDRNDVLNKNFKYTNIGIGLFDVDNDIKLNDKEYGKLIYKIIYHNFIAINETLSIVNGKLYVNWLNIYPLTIENYRTSNIYINTDKNLSNAIKNLQDDNFIDLLDYNGIYIGEYYNIFRNVYYQSIKKVKWFIFIKNNEYIIQYLNKKIDFTNIEDYDELNIWKTIILFFVNNYTFKNKLKNNNLLKKFSMEIEIESADSDLNETSDELFNKISYKNIKEFINNIEANHLWNYFKESLIIFETTMYAKHLINENKITNFITLPNSTLNLKNIYNISKSLSHYSQKNWNILPVKYSSLDLAEQKNFWSKLNKDKNFDEDNTLNTTDYKIKYEYEKWINLKNNLKIEANILPIQYNNVMKEKLTNFYDNKDKLIWEYLVYNGILTDFKINLAMTDSTKYKSNKNNHIKKTLKATLATNEYDNAYYFLTNKKYKDHKFRTHKDEAFATETSFLKNISEMLWYSFYAMDWIVQINFFHHYLNHRVLYITGGTGQGKSTQVPKLFMYALKMLDYKNNGIVVCTQPRIGPTNSNAIRIADELGVPIDQYSNTFKTEIKSDNYYVQIKHSGVKHVKSKVPHLSLNIMTDGTFFEEILNNPILKDVIKKDNIYTDCNKYDIIIIDEAHEHGDNMDLILTLARQTCYMNNSIKLVIMSATMDDDEPGFRRYYNNINDNLVYPIRAPFIDYFQDQNITNTTTFLYDSIYLDRRFHIAPPGQTTQYTVIENYVPNENTDALVLNIITTTQIGDILVFESGMNEIIKRVKSLNDILPKNVIAIPYLAALDERYKKIIENEQLYKVSVSKKTIHTVWLDKYVDSKDVNIGTYKRCIIVATNVAEASLTLSKLKFVIDNGYSKVNYYDYELNSTKLINEEISEASRKQRKGRVGRTSDGTIYYLYNKGAREHIKSKYKINQGNFGDNFIKMLETKNINNEKNNTIDEEYIMNTLYDPNIPNEYIKNIHINLNENEQKNFNETFFYKSQIFNIIKNQFMLINYEQNLIDKYLTYWDPIYFSNMLNDPLLFMNRKKSGYDLETLLDKKGLFYIIHPFEDKFKRNILGNIIEYKPYDDFIKFKNYLSDNIFKNLMLNLNYKYFLVNIQDDFINSLDNKIVTKNICKTEFVGYVNELRKNIDLEIITNEDIIILLTARAYKSFDEVLEILAMIKAIDSSIEKLVDNMKLYNEQDIDIEFIYNMIMKFKKKFSSLKVFNMKTRKNLINTNKTLVDNYLNKYKLDKIKNRYDPPKVYSIAIWNKLNLLNNTGRLNTIDGFDNIIYDLLEFDQLFDNYNDNEINIWCKNNNLKFDAIKNFLITFKSIKIASLTIDKNKEKYDDNIDILEKMDNESLSFIKLLTLKNKSESIIRPFIHGLPLNVGIRFKTDDYYHKIKGSLNIVNEHKINNSNVIFFYGKKEETTDTNINFNVNITNRVEINWLYNALPLYYKPNNFKNIYIKNYKNKIETEIINGNLYDNFCVKLRNCWKKYNIPFDSTEMPILSLFIKNFKRNNSDCN